MRKEEEVKVLILAAGFGKRLQPITNDIPKSMVQVNGTPLLENALNILVSFEEISEIGIVVGHKAEYIKEKIGNRWGKVPIRYFENERYLETNNVVSLYKAYEFCDDDMLMLECDLFYRREVIEKLIKGDGECSILVSDYNPTTMDGTILEVKDDVVQELILGKWQDEDRNYKNAKKTVNMYKFSKDFLMNKYMPLVKWYVENMSENSYYETVLGSLIYYRECDIRVVEVSDQMWSEIDDIDDLERTKKKFAYNTEPA